MSLVDLRLSMCITIDEKDIETLKKIADHHIEHLIDLDNFPEIRSVCDVRLEKEEP